MVKDLEVDILGGTPFLRENDVYSRVAQNTVYVGNSQYPYKPGGKSSQSVTARVTSITPVHVTLQSKRARYILPGEEAEFEVPDQFEDADVLAVESRSQREWPSPQLVDCVGGKFRIQNTSENTQVLNRHEHFATVRATQAVNDIPPVEHGESPLTQKASAPVVSEPDVEPYKKVSVDPDHILSSVDSDEFERINQEYAMVFEQVTTGYNGYFGKFEAEVNMGPTLPPQRKGRVPLYSHGDKVILQERIDALTDAGIVARPQDVGVNVEYVSPTFLVKKPDGSWRLVTAFAEIGRYAKPAPSFMPDVDSILRAVGKWRYIIVTDLSSAFYQILLAKKSQKYCGFVSPFKGLRVYQRTAMGMPGSEVALEELLSLVLGDCIRDEIVARLADDLCIGGQTIPELMQNYRRVLSLLAKANLKLSPKKTIIAPRQTMILGWIWTEGTLKASPHRVVCLQSCEVPNTVKSLRSFIGAYRALSRVVPRCSDLLAPLHAVVAGKESAERIVWSEPLEQAFRSAQEALSDTRVITLPVPSDQLWIVTDGAQKKPGVGATLFFTRKGELYVAGFFSAKLNKNQVTWLPCETEAVGIASAVRFFSPFIVQSEHKTRLLTDSKPCVEAYQKLSRGEFSSSPRVTTMLSTAARFQVIIGHLAGDQNVIADFQSRNAPQCFFDLKHMY